MRNQYEVRGDITAIILESRKNGRLETLISTDKLKMVQEFPNTWFVTWNKCTRSFYCFGSLYSNSKRCETVYLHRFIMDCPSGLVVDHINHDTLDNTNNNIRIVSQSENMQNRSGISKNNKSGVRGVHFRKDKGKWCSEVYLSGKKRYVGYFENIHDAEVAIKNARAELMEFSEEARKRGVV